MVFWNVYWKFLMPLQIGQSNFDAIEKTNSQDFDALLECWLTSHWKTNSQNFDAVLKLLFGNFDSIAKWPDIIAIKFSNIDKCCCHCKWNRQNFNSILESLMTVLMPLQNEQSEFWCPFLIFMNCNDILKQITEFWCHFGDFNGQIWMSLQTNRQNFDVLYEFLLIWLMTLPNEHTEQYFDII